jgi:cytochrome c-type biogenesis protein CcmH
MILWFIFGVLTFAVMVLLLLPLLSKSVSAPQRSDYDIVIYRDQLAEVDMDVERLLLSSEQAEAARAEIYRRMFQTEDDEKVGAGSTPMTTSSPHSKLVLAIIVVIFLPLGSLGVYTFLGSPELPGKPYAQRKDDPDFIMGTEAEQLAGQLEKSPDAQGYKHLADTYFMMRSYDQAAEAYRKVIDLNGGDANVWSELGEAIAMSHDGLVVPEAHVAFIKAYLLNSQDMRSRFYLGLLETQINEPRRAVAIWKDLQKDGPVDAPWMPMLKEHIEGLAKEAGFDPTSVPRASPSTKSPHDLMPSINEQLTEPVGPSSVDPEAAAAVLAMKPEAQNAMIHKMVDRLATEMQNNPNDRDGWLRLAKAYRALGENDKADAAESKAAALQAETPN